MTKAIQSERCGQHYPGYVLLEVEGRGLCYACIVCELYADMPSKTLAEWLGRSESGISGLAHKLGVFKSPEYFSTNPGCYPRGHVPANKGLRRPGYAPGRMAQTQFKRGERSGFAEDNWKSVGTIVADPEGFLRIKIAERVNGKPIGWDKSIWPLLHHQVWERHHGPIPPGHKIAFKDGDRRNTAIENLEILTHAEMMARNTIHNLPRELKDVIHLTGKIKQVLRRRLNEEHNGGLEEPSL
jgi:hypothetical protein